MVVFYQIYKTQPKISWGKYTLGLWGCVGSEKEKSFRDDMTIHQGDKFDSRAWPFLKMPPLQSVSKALFEHKNLSGFRKDKEHKKVLFYRVIFYFIRKFGQYYVTENTEV